MRTADRLSTLYSIAHTRATPFTYAIMCVAISIAIGTGLGFTQPEIQPDPQPHPQTEPQAEPDQPAATQPTQSTPQPESDPTIHDAVKKEIRVYLLGSEQAIQGTLVALTDDQFILRIGTITQAFDLARLDRFDIIPSIAERYASIRALIADDDMEQIGALCAWVMREGREDLALPDLEAAAQHAPNNVQIAEMLRGARARALLREKAGKPKPKSKPSSNQANPKPTKPNAFPVLTDDQINLIKVFEIDLASNPRITIPAEVIDRMLTTYADQPGMPTTDEGKEAIRRQSARQQLDLLYRLKARELYPFVQIREHPPQIQTFRDRVHRTWLINSCATTACHGGPHSGRLKLKVTQPTLEATYYTNLIILDRFVLSDGAKLINYEKPADSPLLQLGLDRKKSTHPHPVVPGSAGTGDAFRAFFRSVDERRYQQAVQWLEGMYKPRPDYGIDYVPPMPSEPTKLPETDDGGR